MSDRDPTGRTPDRAQSEALGFLLLFGVVVLVLGLVVTAGYANLVDARDHERVSNAERSFESFAANVDAVVRNDAPSRSTELAVADGRLVTRPATTLSVSWTESGSGVTRSETVTLRSLAYDAGTGERVVFEGGAVFRANDAGATLVRAPSFRLQASRVVVPVVQLDGIQRVGASGRSNVLLRTARDDSESSVLVRSAAAHDVTVEVTSPRAAAWERYLDDQPAASCTRAGDTVTCSVDADRLTVVFVEVDVSDAG